MRARRPEANGCQSLKAFFTPARRRRACASIEVLQTTGGRHAQEERESGSWTHVMVQLGGSELARDRRPRRLRALHLTQGRIYKCLVCCRSPAEV